MALRIDNWAKEGKGFFLKDDYIIGEVNYGDINEDTWTGKWRGRIFASMPDNMIGYDFNPTALPGKFNAFYLTFTINASHAAAQVMRLNEKIWVTPTYQKYYNLIIHQKEQLETKIKQALVSISQSISDLELLEHDLRKYEEYEHYLRDYKSGDEEKKRVAERFLKMIFVEQVDYHVGSTGQGPGRFSMAFLRNNNIMPTIVDDFLEIHSLEDIDKLKGKISGAERHVLLTKYKAFEEWLRMFETAVRTRLERLRLLKRSREKSLEEFRKWARPLIQKLKALEEALENKKGAKDYISHPKLHNIMGFMRQTMHVWMFKNMLQPYEHAADQKSISHYDFGDKDPYNPLNPWNKWNKHNLAFNYDYGLIADHPWISYEWADSNAEKWYNGFLKNHKYSIYYLFLLTFIKTDYMQITQGAEIEDIDFVFYPSLLSHNLVLVKLLEYEAFMKEFDDYTDEFLGIVERMEGKAIVGYIKKGSSYYLAENFIKKWYLNSKTPLWYPEQYERMKKEIEKRLKGKNASSMDSIAKIKFTKKEFQDVFSEDLFYASYHPRENKFLSFIEDKILGFTLWLRKYPPYETTFRDTITRVYYKQLAAEFSKLYKPLENNVILP